MRILLTNDDGIHAPGIHALIEALQPLGDIFVVAPEKPRSASGHAITLHKPLRLVETPLPNGRKGWACSGTPTDCVTLGWDIVLNGKVDLVISGINSGPNIGWDVTYSGTVSAAIEGAILGAPAIAVSVASEREPLDYVVAANFTRTLAERVRDNGLEKWSLLNVNVPSGPSMEIKGVTVTHQGRRQYIDRIDKRTDPWGKEYYWLCGSLKDEVQDPLSDGHQVAEGFISVTPIHLDLTAYKLIDTVRAWNLTA